MAVAARSSGSAEARVPCPLCGGLIHPIAGRCKHCKADLAAYRSARPAAAAALPALAPTAPAAGAAGNHGNVAAPVAAAPTAPTSVTAPGIAARPDASQPVLPPRPTGRIDSAAPRSVWRNWPLIVIVLALIAIATAVVLMVWPASRTAKADSRSLAPPPAPERMDTNTLPPPSAQPPAQGTQPPGGNGVDPWTTPGGSGPSGRIDPLPPDPLPADPDDQNIDPDDIFKDPFGAKPGRPHGGLGTTGFGFTIFKHACNRATNCGNSDPSVVAACNALDSIVPPAPTPPCAAAQRCLDRIDQLDCSASFSATDMGALMMKFKDCTDAVFRC